MDGTTAGILIDYIETLAERSHHQQVMSFLTAELNITEDELNKACRELGKIAGRDFSIT